MASRLTLTLTTDIGEQQGRSKGELVRSRRLEGMLGRGLEALGKESEILSVAGRGDRLSLGRIQQGGSGSKEGVPDPNERKIRDLLRHCSYIRMM